MVWRPRGCAHRAGGAGPFCAGKQQALQDRKQIDRAKGLLMEKRGLSEADAYAALRQQAMKQGVKLTEVARRIVAMAEYSRGWVVLHAACERAPDAMWMDRLVAALHLPAGADVLEYCDLRRGPMRRVGWRMHDGHRHIDGVLLTAAQPSDANRSLLATALAGKPWRGARLSVFTHTHSAWRSDRVHLHACLGRSDARRHRRRRHVAQLKQRGGCRSTPQEFICRLMRRYALQGRRVVRVKGDDALLFGHAGEEIAFLRRAGVGVQVIDGVSAAFAAVAALDVSLTHRSHCHGITFVTAHTHDHGEPNWGALAASGTTLGIYMGLRRADALAAALLAGTPAAIVQAATRPEQQRRLTALGDLGTTAAALPPGLPTLLLVGDALSEAAAACDDRDGPMAVQAVGWGQHTTDDAAAGQGHSGSRFPCDMMRAHPEDSLPSLWASRIRAWTACMRNGYGLVSTSAGGTGLHTTAKSFAGCIDVATEGASVRVQIRAQLCVRALPVSTCGCAAV
ncbi:Uroporphyrinogen-III methylase [Xanthomonas citri pv. citri]|nr:uroporphyrin-III C-methyltransferase [Xanthomonas axonopodis Xac29-1]AJD68743.1 uroporphyrinogen-III methylase [Xanthomonas citri subsp. citri A306]AJY82268.1 Uroporphyrinogen-III methylase [Xanthomonas citri pv. citri]AJY86691.1 Uroporphyrinogen-III methylase [Xanthomonas citri subsp. citri UI6]AJY91123.1 Uroporphyrinogen-III methylase [Xanthomonas citri pv. citri]